MELTIQWSSRNEHRVTALVDTGAECTQLHSNSQKFSGPLSAVDNYGGQNVMVRKVPLVLQIGRSHCQKYEVFTSSILKTYWAWTSCKASTFTNLYRGFRLREQVIKSVLRGKANKEPVSLPPPQRVPGKTQEKGKATQELHCVGIVCSAHSAWNNPVWPGKKPDGSRIMNGQ